MVGTTARVHCALRLVDLSLRVVLVSGDKVGEALRNFDPDPGEFWIVDRGYSNPPSVLRAVDRGSDILVRLNS
jgi:hypothetical protein